MPVRARPRARGVSAPLARHALVDPLAHLRSERDELIGKLASGTDYEASLRRWKELLAEHDTDQRVDADGTRTGDLTIPVDAGWLLELRAFGTSVPAHVLEPFCLLSAVKAAPIA